MNVTEHECAAVEAAETLAWRKAAIRQAIADLTAALRRNTLSDVDSCIAAARAALDLGQQS